MDISLMIGKIKFNLRVGVVLRYQDEVLIELSKIGTNSVIPGGRIKVGEDSRDALKREMEEEMGFSIAKEKLSFVKLFENFFTYENTPVHELFIVYEYPVCESDYQKLCILKDNKDNNNTYFSFIKLNDLDKVNLLPEALIDTLKDTSRN